ncbi:hypothetical protein [Actinomadura sp. KC06]|uniref:hypothetical protein n=1 Tax=Actinomadura sp. KC06 TaxID=2530369 RepID=UPI0014046DA2|nr:hypothetical protein [Actinomadura sp. KC06]
MAAADAAEMARAATAAEMASWAEAAADATVLAAERAAIAAGAAAKAAYAAADAAETAEAIRNVADAAVRALQVAALAFTALRSGFSPAHMEVASVAQPPGVLTRRLVAVGCALLPAGDRDRYGEEWLSLLTELPTRRARAREVLSILCGAPRQAWALRRPLKPVPPA